LEEEAEAGGVNSAGGSSAWRRGKTLRVDLVLSTPPGLSERPLLASEEEGVILGREGASKIGRRATGMPVGAVDLLSPRCSVGTMLLGNRGSCLVGTRSRWSVGSTARGSGTVESGWRSETTADSGKQRYETTVESGQPR
jgi:hypothetical protein